MSSPLANPGPQKNAPGEAFHVLFSPPVAPNGVQIREAAEKQSSPLARSTSKTPAPERSFTFRDYTPRKSGGFSPHGNGKASAAGSRETQTPPPPTTSLFDTGAFQKSAGMELRVGGRGDVPGPSSASHRMFSQPESSVGAMVEDYESCWVTVYGFNGTCRLDSVAPPGEVHAPIGALYDGGLTVGTRTLLSCYLTSAGRSRAPAGNDLPLVLREFSKCGEIVDFSRGTDGPYVNWVYIAFDNKFGAQRALLRSGCQLSPTCMIGVKEMDAAKLAAMDGASRELITEMLRHEPLERVQRPNKKLIAAGEEPVVPLESASVWDKFSEFVLGL